MYYLLKNNDGDYVGYLAVVPKEDAGELFLSKIYVRSGERQKGYGRNAVQFIEDLARQMNLRKISLTVNKHNVNSIVAYEKMGFRNIGSVVTDIGAGFAMDDYRMEKSVEH